MGEGYNQMDEPTQTPEEIVPTDSAAQAALSTHERDLEAAEPSLGSNPGEAAPQVINLSGLS